MSTESIGLLQQAGEWGMEMHGQVYVDSSAAQRVVKRKGNGKMRHIRISMLWIQEERIREIGYNKVPEKMNHTDLMSK